MKYLLFFTVILFTQRSFAQLPYYDFKKFKQNNGEQYQRLDLNKQNQIISKDSIEKILKKLREIKYSPNFG